MAYFDASLNNGGRGFTLRLTVNQDSQSIGANTSTVSWSLTLIKGSNSYSSWTKYWSVNIGGVTASGSIPSYDFRAYSSLLLGSGTAVIGHNADGTKYLSSSGSFDEGTHVLIGSGTASGGQTLTTIPRATQPSVSPTSGETGTSFTITHSPATASFYHDIAYSVDGGASFTDIQTDIVGTDTTTDWTPAPTLIPDVSSVTAIIRATTKNGLGGAVIGTKTVNLPLSVPASLKPTVSSVSWLDAQISSPDMPTLMGGAGRFVQRWSKLEPTVTASGAGGSSVVSSSVTQNGQSTTSGVAFGLPVALSGAVPFSAVALDGRGVSSDPYANTVAVTAYNFPSLPTPLVTRTSDAGGTVPDPTGTYIAITPAASVSSLIFGGSEKNSLEWRVRTRTSGGSFVTVQDWTSTAVSGNTWTTKYVVAGYAASAEHLIEVSIRDLFGANGFNTASTVKTLSVPVPSESVVMDFDGTEGIGIGKYRAAGAMLDVFGQIRQNNGLDVLDESFVVPTATTSLAGVVELSTSPESVAGLLDTRAVTPASLKGALDGGLFDTRYYTEAEVEARIADRGWTPAIATSIASSGAAATLNTTTGVVTCPAGTTSLRLDGLIEPGYEYEFELSIAVAAGSLQQMWFRMTEGGVDKATASYNVGGYWGQYNATWGVYSVNAGTGFAFGHVTGALPSTYVESHHSLRLVPTEQGTNFMAFFEAHTGGYARTTQGAGYTPPPTVAFDGIRFYPGAGAIRGKIRPFKRRLA